MNPENLVLNSKHMKYFLQSGMEIDLGAIVKGYFADQLQQYFYLMVYLLPLSI